MHFLPNLRFVFYLDSIYFLTVNGFKWACPLVPCNPYDILEILNVSALIDSFLYILFFGIFGILVFPMVHLLIGIIHLLIHLIYSPSNKIYRKKTPNILDSELQHLENLSFALTHDLWFSCASKSWVTVIFFKTCLDVI